MTCDRTHWDSYTAGPDVDYEYVPVVYVAKGTKPAQLCRTLSEVIGPDWCQHGEDDPCCTELEEPTE